MDPERTILRAGSVSKLFTWTAVMQLVEQGKVELDRDINDYLDLKVPAAFDQPITVRHLMTHTAGFEERIKQYGTAGSAPGSPLSVHLKAVPSPARIYPPGAVPAYSNYGTMLGGYIVERVSGEPFVDYIERHILQPLGMERSTFRRSVSFAPIATVTASSATPMTSPAFTRTCSCCPTRAWAISSASGDTRDGSSNCDQRQHYSGSAGSARRNRACPNRSRPEAYRGVGTRTSRGQPWSRNGGTV